MARTGRPLRSVIRQAAATSRKSARAGSGHSAVAAHPQAREVPHPSDPLAALAPAGR